MSGISQVKVLTFDLFGTVFDLSASLLPGIARFLEAKDSDVPAGLFWSDWRNRQRLEQFQDSLMLLGHSGYLETVRRALVYTLRLHCIEANAEEVLYFLRIWQDLDPFPDVMPALTRLRDQFTLVVLSNGDPEYLQHLASHRLRFDFEAVLSVSAFGAFKPHPAVYRGAARRLGVEVSECMMVSSNAFDVVGARACGFRGAFVDRYKLPYDESPFLPDVTVKDFRELADVLLADGTGSSEAAVTV